MVKSDLSIESDPGTEHVSGVDVLLIRDAAPEAAVLLDEYLVAVPDERLNAAGHHSDAVLVGRVVQRRPGIDLEPQAHRGADQLAELDAARQLDPTACGATILGGATTVLIG